MRLNVGGAADYLKAKLKRGEDGNAQVASLLGQEHQLGVELRKPFEQIWMLSLAYISSRQYVYFNATAHQLDQLLKYPGERRVVDNQILPKWKRQVADLIKNDPEMSVVPNTTNEQDIQAARIGDKVLRFWWRNASMRRTVRQLAVWLYSTGNAFVEDRWDAGIGPVQLDPESGELRYLGDVSCGLWSPFEVVVPVQGMFTGELNDLPWVETTKWRTFEWMKKFLGASAAKKIKEVTPQEAPAEDATLAALFGRTSARTSPLTRGAVFQEFKIQPCEEFKKGAQVFLANGKVLYRADYPYVEYPIQHFKDVEIAGCFWGSPTTEHAIQLQNRWNRTLNSIDTFNEVMGKGKWMAPKGANLSVEPNDRHGEVMTYTPQMGLKPEHLSLKGLPNSYDLILMSTRASFENLFSQHEVSRGTNKSDIRSGEMVSLLREQDAHGNIPSHAVFEESIERLARRVLVRIQKGYTTERTIKIPGQDQQWEVLAFKGAELQDNTDVSVRRQSSLPDSRSAREARIMERFERGVYGDPRDPSVRRDVMNKLNDAIVENSFADIRLDETVSRNENMMLFRGEVERIQANPYDNHQIHAVEHDRFRKSFNYQKVKFENPEAFALMELRFEEHQNQHRRFIAEMERKMLAQQLAVKGGGGRASS